MNGLVVQQWKVRPTAEVRARLAELAARGELVAYEATYAGPRGLAVRVTVRPAARAIPTDAVGRRWRAYAIGAVIGTAAAVLGIAVWALLALAAWVASHVAELVGLAVTLALLGAAVLRVGGGRSGHCSGPNSGH